MYCTSPISYQLLAQPYLDVGLGTGGTASIFLHHWTGVEGYCNLRVKDFKVRHSYIIPLTTLLLT